MTRLLHSRYDESDITTTTTTTTTTVSFCYVFATQQCWQESLRLSCISVLLSSQILLSQCLMIRPCTGPRSVMCSDSFVDFGTIYIVFVCLFTYLPFFLPYVLLSLTL